MSRRAGTGSAIGSPERLPVVDPRFDGEADDVGLVELKVFGGFPYDGHVLLWYAEVDVGHRGLCHGTSCTTFRRSGLTHTLIVLHFEYEQASGSRDHRYGSRVGGVPSQAA